MFSLLWLDWRRRDLEVGCQLAAEDAAPPGHDSALVQAEVLEFRELQLDQKVTSPVAQRNTHMASSTAQPPSPIAHSKDQLSLHQVTDTMRSAVVSHVTPTLRSRQGKHTLPSSLLDGPASQLRFRAMNPDPPPLVDNFGSFCGKGFAPFDEVHQVEGELPWSPAKSALQVADQVGPTPIRQPIRLLGQPSPLCSTLQHLTEGADHLSFNSRCCLPQKAGWTESHGISLSSPRSSSSSSLDFSSSLGEHPMAANEWLSSQDASVANCGSIPGPCGPCIAQSQSSCRLREAIPPLLQREEWPSSPLRRVQILHLLSLSTPKESVMADGDLQDELLSYAFAAAEGASPADGGLHEELFSHALAAAEAVGSEVGQE